LIVIPSGEVLIFEDLGLLFFTSLILSLLLTPASISFAHYIGAVDNPVARSVHTQTMTRLGGLGMIIALLTSLMLFLEITPLLLAFLMGMACMVLTGVADDLFQISPAKKMFGQIIACISFLWLSGLSLNNFGDLLGFGDIYFSDHVAGFITLFCMVGLVNAFNLSDGLDGLAAGVTVIAAIFMAVLALQSENWLALAIILALLGGVFGFLKYNTYPAKLFMGDTGSLSLGFFIACIVVYLIDFKGKLFIQPISLAIILALPIADTLIVMTTRILKGQSPVSPDKTHLHHRLLALGFSHAAVVIFIYVLAFLFGLLALAIHQHPAWVQLLFAIAACSLLYGLLFVLERCESKMPSRQRLEQQELGLETRLTKLMGRSINWFRFVILLGLLLPIFFVPKIPDNLHNLLLSSLALLLFAFPWKEHKERLNIVYALFYLAGLSILYVWNTSTYQSFDMSWYTVLFVMILSVWAALKVRFKGGHEVFLTSGLEVLLIFISWFIPFTLLPILEVSDAVLHAAKTSCLEAIPLFIAMKIVIRRQPDRNYVLVIGLCLILLLMLIVG